MSNKIGASSGGPPPFGDRGEYDYLLRIQVGDGYENTQLNVAIVTQEGLKTFKQETPFEYSFAARGYYIFFESIPKRVKLVAELHSNQFGGFRKVSGTGGSGGGKMIRDPMYSIQCSGGISF